MAGEVRAVLERDPAARNRLEVVLCYPGIWAIWIHRFAHRLWRARLKLVARWLSQLARFATGIEIHPAARIGDRLVIDHGMGVVIGETAQVGNGVTLYHGVTLGGTSLARGKRHPTVEDGVVVGAGAKVLGAITVGQGSRVGANAVVVKDVPPESVVVGVPGEIVQRRLHPTGPDLEHGLLPDVLGETVVVLLERVAALEKTLNGDAPKPRPQPYTSEDGVWQSGDFSI